MNLLFSMSFAGSLVFLAYLVFRPVAVRYFSSAWRYRVLKIALLFYLLPYQYFKYHYYDILFNIFFHRQYQSSEFNTGFTAYDFNRLILIDSEGNKSFKNGTLIIIVLAIWSIAVFLFVLCQVIKYFSCKKALGQISKSSDSDFYTILNQCREHIPVKKKVELFCCPYVTTPFTIGIFSPRIIFPDTLKEEKSFHMVIFHELTHIRNHDILIKFLALLVLVLHWFNPLTYLLYWEICRVYEYVCDETVTQNMTQEEKEDYKSLIIEMAEKSSPTNTVFANSLSSNFKIIKERITLMDKVMVHSKIMRIASFVLAVFLLALSPLPVLAYSPMLSYKSGDPSSDIDFEGILYNGFDQEDFHVFGIYDPFLELGSDYDIFVDVDGFPSTISERISQTERSVCTHTWQSGQLYQHIKNNDGSCTVNIYQVQICSKCNYINYSKLINSVQYAVCPH